MVNQRRKQVGEQNGQHHPFRVRWVHHPNQDYHDTNQGAVEPAAGIGHGGRNRVCGHKDQTKGKTAQNHVPVPGHLEHGVGVRTDKVKQRGQGNHANHGAGHNAPGRDAGEQQDGATDKDRQCRGLTNRALHHTKEGIHPGDRIVQHLHATLLGHAQHGCAGKTVNRRPHQFAGNLCRVGKEQKRTTRQSRVEEVLTGTTKHLFTDDHTEGDTQGHLPQRDGGRYDQGEQDRRNKEALVHFVLTHNGKQHFPETTDKKCGGVHRQEEHRTIDHVVPQAGRVVASEQGDEHTVPVSRSRQATGNSGIGLIADVPHTKKHGRESTQPDDTHHPLQVDGITHMAGVVGFVRRCVKQRVRRFIQRVELLVLTALDKLRLH